MPCLQTFMSSFVSPWPPLTIVQSKKLTSDNLFSFIQGVCKLLPNTGSTVMLQELKFKKLPANKWLFKGWAWDQSVICWLFLGRCIHAWHGKVCLLYSHTTSCVRCDSHIRYSWCHPPLALAVYPGWVLRHSSLLLSICGLVWSVFILFSTFNWNFVKNNRSKEFNIKFELLHVDRRLNGIWL